LQQKLYVFFVHCAQAAELYGLHLILCLFFFENPVKKGILTQKTLAILSLL